jgi:hypothetical protein
MNELCSHWKKILKFSTSKIIDLIFLLNITSYSRSLDGLKAFQKQFNERINRFLSDCEEANKNSKAETQVQQNGA